MKFPSTFAAVFAAIACVSHFAPAQTGARITLRSGEVVSGVLRSEGYEAPRGGLFVSVDETEPNAGVRLFRPQGASGFLFVARSSIAKIDRNAPTPAVAFDAAAAMRAWAQWREREWERLAGYRAQNAARRDALDDEVDGEEPLSEVLDESTLAELIERFHPVRGWTPGYRAVLKWRSLVLHLYPATAEREWLDLYPAWRIAYDWWLTRAVPGFAPGAESER